MIKKIHNFLIENNKTISVCESVTAGALSLKLISNPGSSAFFKGSLVVYNDEIKSKLLKIDLEKIKKFSAVSKEISLEMAKSVKMIFESDYSISTTGNAGPQNSDKISKKGGLFITIVTPSKIITKEYSLKDLRSKNIQNAVAFAINLLYKNLN